MNSQNIISISLFLQLFRMSQSRLQKSRCKLIKNISATDILHQGIKRRITSAQYTKIYPKTKLTLKNRPNTITILKNEFSEEEMRSKIYKMKQQNKTLEEQNHDILTKIRKQSKLNDIYDKKLDRANVEEMEFQKLLEIKLLLQVEELEEQLVKIEHQFMNIVKSTKRRREQTNRFNHQTQIQLIAILSQSPQEIQLAKQLKHRKLADIHQKQDKLQEKNNKMKQKNRQKIEQIKRLTVVIQKQKAKLPNKSEWAVQSNDSGIHNLQTKNKSMQQLQKQIVRSREEYAAQEIKIQQAIDKSVAQKILIYKQMEEIKNETETHNKQQHIKPKSIRW